MVYELMRLTLVLCIVIAPVLFVSQIFLMRIRRSSEKRLTAMHAGLDLDIRTYAHVASQVPPREFRPQLAPEPAPARGADLCLPLMHSATK